MVPCEASQADVLIALLAMLGVDLIVIAVFVTVAVARRRWLKRQPGAFAGAISVTSGDLPGLGPKWKRGSGRWVRDVLVWNHGSFQFRTKLIPVDRCSGERRAGPGELKRLGDAPVVVELACGDAIIEVAARAEHRLQAMGPYAQ